MDARETVRAYYDSLRNGEPLPPYFADAEGVVKFGISERLLGGEAVAARLAEQTETTADWTVESRQLRMTERECHAWFADEVAMGWLDTERQVRYEFDTRWSGTMERREHDWRFVTMHVSTAGAV